MMNKDRNSRNTGKPFCSCCWARVPNSTVRAREKREWGKESRTSE